MCSENVWCVNFHRDAKSRVRYQNKFNAEAAASILDGNKLGKHPLVVVPYENLTTGLVEVGPGASEDSIEGALAGSLWWKPVVDSDGTRSAYILASFSSAPVGDEMREIARMLGTEQKAVLEFRDGRFGPCTVSISGIDYKVKARQLRAAFQAAGTVVKVELKKNGRGKSSGKAWVTFLEPDGATTAVEGLDNAVVGRRDRPVRVRRTAHSGQST